MDIIDTKDMDVQDTLAKVIQEQTMSLVMAMFHNLIPETNKESIK